MILKLGRLAEALPNLSHSEVYADSCTIASLRAATRKVHNCRTTFLWPKWLHLIFLMLSIMLLCTESLPTSSPTCAPTIPTATPTAAPTYAPTVTLTCTPTVTPTCVPTTPTVSPTVGPTCLPTVIPTASTGVLATSSMHTPEAIKFSWFHSSCFLLL